jgi:hypothetical protein
MTSIAWLSFPARACFCAFATHGSKGVLYGRSPSATARHQVYCVHLTLCLDHVAPSQKRLTGQVYASANLRMGLSLLLHLVVDINKRCLVTDSRGPLLIST